MLHVIALKSQLQVASVLCRHVVLIPIGKKNATDGTGKALPCPLEYIDVSPTLF